MEWDADKTVSNSLDFTNSPVAVFDSRSIYFSKIGDWVTLLYFNPSSPRSVIHGMYGTVRHEQFIFLSYTILIPFYEIFTRRDKSLWFTWECVPRFGAFFSPDCLLLYVQLFCSSNTLGGCRLWLELGDWYASFI